MNNRVKELRLALGLSGEKFGKRIGLTRFAISNIEKGKNNVTEQTILAICTTYNVNEQWLRTGDGDMFCLPKDEYISSLTNQYHLSQDDVEIISSFLTLDVEDRKHFLSVANKLFVKPQQEKQ